MEIVESMKKVIQEMIVPELDMIRAENAEIKATLLITNKRLDDINLHLADQSRRIDDTNKRIDGVKDSLSARIDDINNRIDDLKNSLNERIDRLYEVIVRRDEHEDLRIRVVTLEHDIAEIKIKLAA
jgi:chromosome segregation ATPase